MVSLVGIGREVGTGRIQAEESRRRLVGGREGIYLLKNPHRRFFLFRHTAAVCRPSGELLSSVCAPEPLLLSPQMADCCGRGDFCILLTSDDRRFFVQAGVTK